MGTPYNGNPQNYPTSLILFDDSTPPTAANLNVVQQGELDRSAYINAHGGLGLLLSGGLPSTSGGPFTGLATFAACFNDSPLNPSVPSSQYWIFSAYNLGVTTYYTGGDGIWTSLASLIAPGSLPTPPTDFDISAEAAGSPGTVWLAAVNGLNFDLWKLAPGGSSFTLIANLAVATGCTDVQLAQAPASSGKAVYVAVGATSGGNASLGWADDSGSHSQTAVTTATLWLLESNGSYGIAIPKQAIAGLNAFKSNAAGTTWTGTPIGLGATDVPIALTWNKIRSLWFLAVNVTGTGGVNTFYSSPDGVTWTNVGTTLTGHANTFTDLKALGPFLLGCDSDGTSTPTIRLYASADGGFTWYATSYRVIGSESTDSGRILVAPGGGIVLQARKATSGSTNSPIRFSNAYGIGDQVVT